MNEIFNEKYRPQSFEDVIGLDSEIPKLIKDGNIPHLLFEGPAGTGKTTVAKIIIKELNADVLVLNASKDRGINVIRERIEPFATKAANKIKIVFLDEFDATTPAFQTALRNFMETHARTTRFIATCNYSNKIIPPLLSRFSRFTFSRYKDEDKFNHIKKIVDKENIKINEENIKYLIKRYKDDIRAMINFLNKNKDKEINKNDISYENTAISILSGLKAKNWIKIRADLLTQTIEYPNLIEEMDLIIFTNTAIPEDIKRRSNILASKYQFEMYFSFNPEICFSAYMAELQELLQW
jgi:replication factor C small subunit